MMKPLCSFRDVIELWPSKEAMAADLSSAGVKASAVSKWWQRDNIPAEWWSAVLSTDKASANAVSAQLLTDFAAREALEARA